MRDLRALQVIVLRLRRLADHKRDDAVHTKDRGGPGRTNTHDSDLRTFVLGIPRKYRPASSHNRGRSSKRLVIALSKLACTAGKCQRSLRVRSPLDIRATGVVEDPARWRHACAWHIA